MTSKRKSTRKTLIEKHASWSIFKKNPTLFNFFFPPELFRGFHDTCFLPELRWEESLCLDWKETRLELLSGRKSVIKIAVLLPSGTASQWLTRAGLSNFFVSRTSSRSRPCVSSKEPCKTSYNNFSFYKLGFYSMGRDGSWQLLLTLSLIITVWWYWWYCTSLLQISFDRWYSIFFLCQHIPLNVLYNLYYLYPLSW